MSGVSNQRSFLHQVRTTLLAAVCLLPLSAQAQQPEAGASIDVRLADRATEASKALGLKSCRVLPVLSTITPAGLIGSSTSGTLSLELTPGLHTTFTLEPYSLRAPDFKLLVSDETGIHEVPAPAPTTYRGLSAAGDEVWASIDQGEVNAIVRTAAAPLNLFYIQPAPAAGDAQPRERDALHVLYAASEVIPTDHTCGVDDCAPCQTATGFNAANLLRSSALRGPGLPCRYVRLNVDCDYPMYQQSSFDVGNTVRTVETVMLGVNQAYHAATFLADIRFTIPQITVRTSDATDPYSSIPVLNGDISSLLNIVGATWPINANRTLSHLFTGRDTAGSAIGLAYIGAACASGFNTGLSQPYFSSVLSQRIQLTAHEIGHNFGMNHDGVGGFVMAPSVANPGDLTFSPNSHTQCNAYLATIPTCAITATPDVQSDGATTFKNRPIRIDVLANDGRSGVACPTTVTGFTLPSSTSPLGATLAISVGTGPGGRNEVLYTPPANVEGVADSFSYLAAAVTVPVSVEVQAPRPADGQSGQDPGINTVYYETRPNGTPNSWWVWDLPPADFSNYAIHSSTTLSQFNFTSTAPSGCLRGLSGVMTGYITIPTTGLWTFTLSAGSSARFYVGPDVSILAPNAAAAAPQSTTRALSAGVHAFRLDYHYGPSSPRLVLSANAEGQPSTVIPASAFFRTAITCRPDFNNNGSLTIDDLFLYLNAYFASQPAADFNGIGGVTIDDLFLYLNAYFTGC